MPDIAVGVVTNNTQEEFCVSRHFYEFISKV